MTKDYIIVNSYQDISKLDMPEGVKVATKGFYKPNDGGNAVYIIRKSNGLCNDGVIKLSNGNYAHLLPDLDGFINVRQLGAKGKGHILDREAFKVAMKISKKILVPKGQYRTDTDVYLDDNIHIKGEKGAIIIGMFVINGKQDITIQGLEFRSFNNTWNYGIRIREKSAKQIVIRKCQFNKKTFVYQDYPINGMAIDTLVLDSCSFKFVNYSKNIPIATIQVLASNLFISNCDFQVKGIDGCIKNYLGTGLMKVSNCKFYGEMDEEILDFYKYTGDFVFTKNIVNISQGGIVRTKPASDNDILAFIRDCSYEFSRNRIIHTGEISNSLVYFSGYNNLKDPIADIRQKVVVFDNIFELAIITTPLNFRGIFNVSCTRNKIFSQEVKKHSICLSGITKLDISNNIIDGGVIVAVATSSPNSKKYLSSINNGVWRFNSNMFNNIDGKEEIFMFKEQGGAMIYIEDNTFMKVKNIVNLRQGEYPRMNLRLNKIFLLDNLGGGAKNPRDLIKFDSAKIISLNVEYNQLKSAN